jgi:hypothetical protein
MINAAEREFEESSKRAAAPAAEGLSGAAESAAAVAAAAAAVAAKGFGHTEADKPAAPPGDFEFRLDEVDKPTPMQKDTAMPGHADAASARRRGRSRPRISTSST